MSGGPSDKIPKIAGTSVGGGTGVSYQRDQIPKVKDQVGGADGVAMQRTNIPTHLSAPFPFYGGKRRWAADIWERLGTPDIYVEPFAGSLAVLLACPHPAPREVVCDRSALISNFWRALKLAPDETAYWADYPTVHQDLTARHKWLIRWSHEHAGAVSDDPDFFDAKAAGWWVWGLSLWIGGGWCNDAAESSTARPFIGGRGTGGSGGLGAKGVSAQRTKIPDKRPVIGGRGTGGSGGLGAKGVSAQRTKIPDKRPASPWTGSSTGWGVSVQRETIPWDKRPSLNSKGSTGRGVSAQATVSDKIPMVTGNRVGGGSGVSYQRDQNGRLSDWFGVLAARLERVVVLNRDWTSAVTTTILADTLSGPGDNICRCVLLDPPYLTDRRKANLYDSDMDGSSDHVAVEAYEWAVRHGDRYRIAYCAHEGDFDVPPGWESLTRGFSGQNIGHAKTRDLIMFSPACSTKQPDLFT